MTVGFNLMLCLTNKRDRLIAIASACLCCVICGVCLAQPPKGPPPPRGSKESREFWSIAREAFKEANNNRRNFGLLVQHPAIQSEIELTPVEFKEIEALISQHMDDIRKHRDGFVKDADKQVCKKDLIEMLNKQDAAFTKKLAEVANLERLLQISVQVYGNRSVTQGEIATRIGLSDEKLIEIRHLTETIRREEFEKFGDKIRELMRDRPQNGQRARDIFKQIDDKVDEAIKAKLTTQQLDALNQLKGPAFEIPKDLFEFRSRGDGSSEPRPPRGGGERKSKEGDGNRHPNDEKDKDNCANSYRLLVFHHS